MPVLMQNPDDPHESTGEGAGSELRVFGGDAPAGWERIGDHEVVRLEKSGMSGVRSIEDLRQDDAATPAPVPHAKHHRVGMITLGMTLAAVVVLLVAVLLVMRFHATGTDEEDFYGSFEMVPGEGGSDSDAFAQRAQAYLAEAQGILKRFAEAADEGPVEGVITGSEGMSGLWERGKRFLTFEPGAIEKMSLELGGEADGQQWATLKGENRLGQDVKAVFQISEDDHLRLDLAATTGASEVSLARLRDAPVDTESMVRVYFGEGNFFTSDYPEGSFRCFKVLDVTGRETGWVYAPLDSEGGEWMEQTLNAGSILMESEDQSSATLRLKVGAGAKAGQFELLEVVSPNWIVRE